MGHDNQQWRDLLGDLEPIHRQWCSEHCLLRLSPLLLFPSISFSFQTYLSSCQHNYAMHCLHVIMLMLEHQHKWLTTHPLIIMLTLMYHSCLLLQTLPPQLCFLYTQLHSSYFIFSFYILTSPKGSSTYLYQGFSHWCTLTLIYTNLCADQSIFTHLEAHRFWKPSHST